MEFKTVYDEKTEKMVDKLKEFLATHQKAQIDSLKFRQVPDHEIYYYLVNDKIREKIIKQISNIYAASIPTTTITGKPEEFGKCID